MHSRPGSSVGTWRVPAISGEAPDLPTKEGSLSSCSASSWVLLPPLFLFCSDGLLALSWDLLTEARRSSWRSNRLVCKDTKSFWASQQDMLPWGEEGCYSDTHKTERTGVCSCAKAVLKKQDGCGLLWASIFLLSIFTGSQRTKPNSS